MKGDYVFLDTYGAETELMFVEVVDWLVDEAEVRKRVGQMLREIEEAKAKLEELERRCRNALVKVSRGEVPEHEAYLEVREVEEEIESEIKQRQRVRWIPEREAVIVAMYRLPRTSEKVKREAEKIIERYELTEYDIERLCQHYFGE